MLALLLSVAHAAPPEPCTKLDPDVAYVITVAPGSWNENLFGHTALLLVFGAAEPLVERRDQSHLDGGHVVRDTRHALGLALLDDRLAGDADFLGNFKYAFLFGHGHSSRSRRRRGNTPRRRPSRFS